MKKMALRLVCTAILISGAFGQSSGLSDLSGSHQPAHDDVCLSDKCKEASDHLRRAMNASADPCHDFYNYACGNWVPEAAISDSAGDANATNRFQEISEKMKLTIQDMLGKRKTSEFTAETTVKDIFQQCLDKEQNEAVTVALLQKMLVESIGGWPILTPNWNASSFNLSRALGILHGSSPLYRLSVEQDPANASANILRISEPKRLPSLLNLEYYREQYEDFLVNTTRRLHADWAGKGFNSTFKQFADDVQAITEFSYFIDGKSESYPKTRTTLGEVQKNVFHRSVFFRNLTTSLQDQFARAGLAGVITSDIPIELAGKDFFEALDAMLLELLVSGDSGKRLMANYVGWAVIFDNLLYLNPKYREELSVFSGRKSLKAAPREQCAQLVTRHFPWAVGAIYVVDHHIDSDLKQRATALVNDLRISFKRLIASAEWMDVETKDAAARKLSAMEMLVAYPDVFLYDIRLVNREYENVTIGGSYFETLHNLEKAERLRSFWRLVKVNKRHNDADSPVDITLVNVHHQYDKNELVVPASVLHAPLYDSETPLHLSYGALGWMVGREIAKGFGERGSEFDQTGLPRNWWTNASKTAYLEKERAFLSSSANFDNSRPAQAFPDIVGLKAAYTAYFDGFLTQHRRPEPKLRAFPNATAEQLFFLSAAQLWCESPTRSRSYRVSAPLRVATAMANTPEFAAAYHCPSHSRLNPITRPTIW